MLGLFGLGSVSDYVVRHAPCNVVVHKSLPGEHK
jgi:nucleotide-binding universal stress UspA family protein